jgi:hypothetical protein
MAWTKVTIVKDQFAEKSDGTATAMRRYWCKSDAPVSDPDSALTASFGGVTVASRGEAYSAGRPFCTARERTAERKSPRQIEVTVNYKDPTPGADGDFVVSLLGLPARIRRYSVNEMEEYLEDESTPDKKAVRNAAGEPFDHGPERRSPAMVFEIKKYVTLAQSNLILDSWRTTNASAQIIRGKSFDENTLAMMDAQSERITGNIEDATMLIAWRPGGWADKAPKSATASSRPRRSAGASRRRTATATWWTSPSPGR